VSSCCWTPRGVLVASLQLVQLKCLLPLGASLLALPKSGVRGGPGCREPWPGQTGATPSREVGLVDEFISMTYHDPETEGSTSQPRVRLAAS
jgi:hypothetical protein